MVKRIEIVGVGNNGYVLLFGMLGGKMLKYI